MSKAILFLSEHIIPLSFRFIKRFDIQDATSLTMSDERFHLVIFFPASDKTINAVDIGIVKTVAPISNLLVFCNSLEVQRHLEVIIDVCRPTSGMIVTRSLSDTSSGLLSESESESECDYESEDGDGPMQKVVLPGSSYVSVDRTFWSGGLHNTIYSNHDHDKLIASCIEFPSPSVILLRTLNVESVTQEESRLETSTSSSALFVENLGGCSDSLLFPNIDFVHYHTGINRHDAEVREGVKVEYMELKGHSENDNNDNGIDVHNVKWEGAYTSLPSVKDRLRAVLQNTFTVDTQG